MTTDLNRIAEALRQADAAGDVEGARKLASYYRQAAQAAAAAPAADQPGRLGSFASSVGRGALSVIPGTVGGVGYALGSDTLTGAADTIEGGINRMLPVNPEYQDEFLMKGGQAFGQALGMVGTGGLLGAAGKGLALSRGLAQGAAAAKGANLAKNVMLGTGIAQGTRGGGQAAEQYGMQGGAAYARALLGGAIEGASERYLFGMGTELAPVKKFLGEAAEKGVGGIVKSAGTEAGEEAVSQIGGNVATSVLAPYGVQTPGVLEGVGESALLGGIAGGTIGGINALMQPSPTIEGDALVPPEQAPPPVEEPEDDYGVAAFQQQMTEIAAQPDPIEPLQQTVTAAAENSVRVNANVLPATAAVIEAGGLAPAPTVEQPAPVVEQPAPVVEQPRTRAEEIAQMRARLRLNLSAEERGDMEQQLAQAQAEGAAADQTAEERRQAIQREDIIRRQQDREAELQRLAEERQRATAREQQRQQPPVVEETVAPIQPVPAVEETGAPVETKVKKSKAKAGPSLSPSEQLRAEGKVGFPMPTSAGGGWFSTSDWRKSFVEEVPDLWNKVDLLRAVANNRGVMATDKDLADALALGQTLLTQEAPDLARVGYDIARNPAASKQTKEAALAFSKAAEDRLFETGAPEITPEQVPNVENVIDEPGAAEVGSGMEKLNSDFDTLFQLPPAQKRNLSSMREKVIAKMDEIEALPYDSKLTDARDKAFKALEKLLLDIDTERLSQARGNAPRQPERYSGPSWSDGRPTVAEAEAYLTEQLGPELQTGIKGNDPEGWWRSIEDEVRAGTPRNRAIVEAAMDYQKIKSDEARQEAILAEEKAKEATSAPTPTVQRDVTKPEQMTPEVGSVEAKQQVKDRRDSIPAEDLADYDEFMSLLERRGPAQSKVKGFSFTKTDEKRFQELGKKLRKYLFETVSPATDPVIWKDTSGHDIHMSAKRTFYTVENGRVRTGVAFESERFIKDFNPKPIPAEFVEKADAVDFLPEGYVRQGDLYVFQPSGTVEGVTEEKAPAKPKNIAGEVRPERAKPTPAPEFTTIHPKTQEKFNTAFEAKDAGAMNSLLDPMNKGSRAEFERRTGVKLPTTQKGTRDSVETWAATTPVADLTDTELDKDLLRLGEYSKKTYASDALKARALELAKEFQKRQDVAATDKAAGEASTRKKAIAKKALAATGGRGTVGNLAGDSFAQMRADLLSEITGTKVPKAKAGINALMKAFYQEFGIASDTEAGMQKKLAQALQETQTEESPQEFGSTNTVVTKEAKDRAAKSLRESLGQTNVGLNPATLKYAITVGTYYLEGGVRSFADFSAKMVEEFGEGVRKYLQPAYEALRKRTDIDTTGMDPVEGVETAPVAEAPTAPAAAPAAKVEAEAPKTAPTQAAPRPAAVAESDVVGIANARVKAQRERLKLEELNALVGEAYSFPQMWADSESALKVDPTRGSALVKELNEKPRSLKPLEVAILLREEVVRTNALNQAMEEFNAAPSGNNEVERQRMDEAVVALTEVDNAAKVSGTEQGRALNARKLLAKLDYTLPKMLTTLSAANNGSLKDGDLEMVTRLQKRLKDVQDQLAEVESGQADRLAEAEKVAFEAGRQAVLKDIEERAKTDAAKVAEMQKRKAEYLAAKKEAVKTPSKWEEIRAAARARNAELRSNLYSDVVLVKAASMAVNDVIIGATYIAEGVTKFADWVSKMRSEDINLTDDEMQQLFKESKAFDAGEDLPASEAPLKVKKAKAPAIDKVKAIAADEEALDSRTVYNLVVEKMKARVEANPALKKVEMSADDLTNIISEVTEDVQEFFPDITEREIRNLFSGYGIILKPSKDDLAKQIRQLSALGKLQSAIEDAEAKRAPLKSGPQRDKATQAIRLQQKKLARELRMMGRDYEAGEEQLRSPLDAIKARLNNQIDDLAMEINTRKKAPRRPSVNYDKDTQELADLRDELKRISDFINAPAGPTFTELVNEEMKKIDARIAELQKTLAEGNFAKKEDELLHTAELDAKRAVRDALNNTLQKKRREAADKLRTQEDIDKEALEAVEEAITELNRKIEAEDYALPQRRTPTQTAQYEARVNEKKRLQQKVRDARANLFGRKGLTDEQRIKQATAAVDKSIERMQKMLTSGNYDVPKRTSKTPETPELAQKRETRDKLRKQLLELRKLKRDALIDPIAKQLKTDKKRIQTRMDKLKKRMETGDFSKPVKRQKATDDELLALQVEEENLKEAWAKMVFERQLASRGPGKRLLDAGQQTLNTARAVLTSFDVSAVLRQGGFIVLGNPLRGFRNLGPMFQAFGSDKFAKEEKFRLERRENFKNGAYQQSKLFLADVNKVDQMTQQEEAFMSRWIKKLPKGAKGLYIGSAIQGSQRAYTVFLNRLRMDTFDAMVANLKKGSEPTPQEMSAVANYINIATGRGDLGKFNQAGTMLNTVFFAPRLVASRFQILAGYPYFTASGRTKALVLREYGKFFAGATLVYVIGALAQGDDDEPIETDPRSSDFLKIRFGDTRVDPLSGLIQATVLVSRLVSGEKKQASGKIVPIRGEKVPYGADDSFDVMGNFVRTKFSPIVGSLVNVITGKNVVGETTDAVEETKRMLIPMSFTEMKETFEAQGIPEATALTMLQLFGVGVQTYTQGKK